MLSCLCDGAYKRTVAANWKSVAHVAMAAGVLFHYLNGPLPYVRCHITVNRSLLLKHDYDKFNSSFV